MNQQTIHDQSRVEKEKEKEDKESYDRSIQMELAYLYKRDGYVNLEKFNKEYKTQKQKTFKPLLTSLEYLPKELAYLECEDNSIRSLNRG